MATGDLVSHLDFPSLCDEDFDLLDDARGKLIPIRAVKNLDTDDFSSGATRKPQRTVFHVLRLISENGLEKPFLRGQIRFSLRRDFPDQNVSFEDRGTESDDSLGIQIFELRFAHIRNIARDYLGTEFRVAHVGHIGLDVNGVVGPFLHDAIGEDDGVFEVISLPRKIRDEKILSESKFSLFDCHSVCQNIALLHLLTGPDARTRVKAGRLVAPDECLQRVRHLFAGTVDHDNLLTIGKRDLPCLLTDERMTGRSRGDPLHAGSHERRMWHDQWNGLTKHIRAHGGAGIVIVFQKRNERS